MMAEFAEVMRQARRICKVYGDDCDDCKSCPCADNTNYKCNVTDLTTDYTVDEYREFERIVIQWAAEHPEPRYPTWRYAWKQLFPESSHNRPPCLRYFMSEECVDGICSGSNCADCWELPIPADVAEKLGIKPSGGKNHE